MKQEDVNLLKRGERDKSSKGLDDWYEESRRREEERRARVVRYRAGWYSNYDNDSKKTITPWLLIRYDPSDLGVRPVPPNTAFWASPDISVESSDPLGRVVEGENNYVHARVFNLGAADAAPVQVDYFWANPALGLGPANMNPIGTTWVEIPSLTSLDVRCDTAWVPTFVGSGHECLVVNCSNHVFDPLSAPFQPILDRHVGQRNLMVTQAPPSGKLTLALEMNNALVFKARSAVKVRSHRLAAMGRTDRADLDAKRELLANLVAFGRMDDRPTLEAGSRNEKATAQVSAYAQRRERKSVWRGRMRMPQYLIEEVSTPPEGVRFLLDSRGEALEVTKEARRFTAKLLLSKEDKRAGVDEGTWIAGRIEMGALERRRAVVELKIADDARPGEWHVWHLEQQTDGLQVGGYTVVVEVTED